MIDYVETPYLKRNDSSHTVILKDKDINNGMDPDEFVEFMNELLGVLQEKNAPIHKTKKVLQAQNFKVYNKFWRDFQDYSDMIRDVWPNFLNNYLPMEAPNPRYFTEMFRKTIASNDTNGIKKVANEFNAAISRCYNATITTAKENGIVIPLTSREKLDIKEELGKN